jgi:hypothetical protein
MQPRQTRETFIPVDPNRAYSIVFSYEMILEISYDPVERGTSLIVADRASGLMMLLMMLAA